jgi:hypothetical protein
VHDLDMRRSFACLALALVLGTGCDGQPIDHDPLPEECGGFPCCAADDDCTAAQETCLAPGETRGCPICDHDPGSCTGDADCNPTVSGDVCKPIACTCEGASSCQPGCTATSGCGAGETCDLSTRRCGASTCAVSGEGPSCPENFDCPAGTCERRSCATTADCTAGGGHGVCVEHRCQATYGQCMGPAA